MAKASRFVFIVRAIRETKTTTSNSSNISELNYSFLLSCFPFQFFPLFFKKKEHLRGKIVHLIAVRWRAPITPYPDVMYRAHNNISTIIRIFINACLLFTLLIPRGLFIFIAPSFVFTQATKVMGRI